MFLERWGKQLFTKISLPLFYILMLSPLLFTAALIYMEKSAFQELEDRFSAAVRKGKLAMERKAKKERFLHRYSHRIPGLFKKRERTAPIASASSRLAQKRADPGKALLSRRQRQPPLVH